jgi:hypothetical protein
MCLKSVRRDLPPNRLSVNDLRRFITKILSWIPSTACYRSLCMVEDQWVAKCHDPRKNFFGEIFLEKLNARWPICVCVPVLSALCCRASALSGWHRRYPYQYHLYISLHAMQMWFSPLATAASAPRLQVGLVRNVDGDASASCAID